ncbi:macro domain-containing protein [Silvanigrella aquatica]|uniref:Macro domain-containing protein n=1 Tax=Silvanigrella aquatica TaxID=1915309 RepID=A0A1L4CXJ9_9BACT|nr:macro domain-containing protein [Silvanigrella aquatica]APJ02668.1 hypothetical protein AXG55_01465 [Silvanigrella aquatica]
MLFQIVENIFDLYPEAVAHPVNSIGLSHDLLSKKIKRIWPDYYRDYARACLRKHLEPYRCYHYQINALFGTNHIMTMTIRNNWQEKLKQESMRETIQSFIQQCHEQKITTVAIPIIESVPQKWLESEIENEAKKYYHNTLNTVYLFNNC